MKQNIIVALFDISSEAYQAFSELKAYSQTTDALVAQAVLIKKENGLIIPAESTDFTHGRAASLVRWSASSAVLSVFCWVELLAHSSAVMQALPKHWERGCCWKIQPKNWITAVLRSLFWRKNPTKLYWTLSSTVSKPLFSGKMQPLPNRTYWQQ